MALTDLVFKQEYYRLDNLLKQDANYNLIYSSRSDGKSYAVKEYCLEEAIKKDRYFVLMFRKESEKSTNTEIVRYFEDMDKVIRKATGNEYDRVQVKAGSIYLYTIEPDEEVEVQDKEGNWKWKTIKGNKLIGKRIGFILHLDKEADKKSLVYPDVYNIVLEEFVSKDGYLIDEPVKLESAISTIFRQREGKIFMLGNLLSRVNPYRSAWGLNRIDKQEQGTIDIYEFKGELGPIKLAAEYVKYIKKQSHALSKKGKQQEKGEWETGNYLTPNNIELDGFNKRYEFVYTFFGFYFLCQFMVKGSDMILYVTRKTTDIKPNTRVIGDIPSLSVLYTANFKPLVDRERIIFDLIKQDKLVFGDNLTGADFYNCLKSMR